MEKRRGPLLLFVLLISGCIEAGSLSLPSEDTRLDLSSIGAQFKELQKTPSAGEMGVPLKSLPNYFLRSSEQGSYSEAFSLGGLPSTTIVWKVYKDPYGKEYENIKADSTDTVVLLIDSSEITAIVTERDDLYRIAGHIGLYTFVSETQNPEEIDSARVYGNHEDVVRKVFEAGIENALSFDLESLGE
ncbi:MAG: hypothetical protein ACE5HH_05510 [Candidatus Hydrothermarchaeales archaeon]